MTEAPTRRRIGRRGWHGHRWARAICLLFAVATISPITSCVYFNTYYNAEKYFRQAEKARAKAEAQRAGARGARSRSQYVILYDKAVRKASIVLEKYPDSDLIDDAMFIAGRALYWQRDYQYAMRSFRDLELNFPESEYSDRARLWRGRTLVALGLAADARVLFSDLMREGSHIGDRAGMRQGELAAGEGDRRGAILEYRKTLDDFPNTRFAAQLWLRIGEANVTIGSPARLDSAMVSFDRALSASPSDSVRYRASLNRGRVRHLQGHPDAALETYQALLNKGSFRAWEGETRILIGRHYRERAQLAESLAEYERVRDDFPQTDVSAMALYETGLLYLQEHGQRERAQEYFAEVSVEKPDSRADSLANVVIKTCAELDGLIAQVWIADSTAAAILIPAADTTGSDPTAIDNAAVTAIESVEAVSVTEEADVELPPALRGYVVNVDSAGQWQPLVPRPTWRDADGQQVDGERKRRPVRPTGTSTLEEYLFMIAELYRDRLVLPDSAAVVYEAIVDRFPDTDQRSRALYSLAWIHFEQLGDPQAARPYLERLVAEYGATAHANAARRLLELPRERTAEEQAAQIFGEIEVLQAAQPDQPERWIPRLDSLARDYPTTTTAARAAYLAAWATENVIGDSVAAEARYDSVAGRFPRTVFADLVERRRKSQRDGLLVKMERELKTLGQEVGPEERLYLIAIEPDSLDSISLSRKHLGFAMRAHRRQQFEAAEELYRASLEEQQGRNGNAHAGLGDAAWRQGYFEDAVDHLRRAVKEKASSLLPHYRLFEYHVQQSQADSANHYLRYITRRDRENPDALSVIDRFPTVASAEPEEIEIDLLETIDLQPSDENLRLPAAFFGIVELPLVRSSVVARYPDDGSDSSSVIVDVLVTMEGRPDSVRVFSGDEPFAIEAVRAVEGYRFYAAENRREEPLNVWVEVLIPFSLPTPAAVAELPETPTVTVAAVAADDTPIADPVTEAPAE